MTPENLISDLITKLYGKTFNGDLEFENFGNYYKLSLYLNKSKRPLIISGEFLNWDAFFVYLTEELRNRQLHHTVRLIAYPLDNTETDE